MYNISSKSIGLYGSTSISLGMSVFGLKGVFIGPIVASIPVVFYKLMVYHQKSTRVHELAKSKK